jgi:hypothetical protein
MTLEILLELRVDAHTFALFRRAGRGLPPQSRAED